MSRRKNETEKMLYRLLPAPSAEQMESAGERVLHRLLEQADRLPASLPETSMVQGRSRVPFGIAAVVVAIIAFVILARTVPPAANTGASVLVLSDGSRVETRAGSEVALEAATDGLRIRLNTGSIIVTAAQQHHGHLYVQTKDFTLSVVGTVFFVNAESAGSRVAVIEGAVEVQQGPASKTLMRGEQASSSPSLGPVSLATEISWSSNAPAHIARLHQSVAAEPPKPAPAPPVRPEFEVTSIKPELPASQDVPLSADIAGFSCHGTDGIRRSPIGQLPTVAAQGRCSGRYISLPVLVGYAYDVHPRRVHGTPDWRPPGKPIDTGFQVEAKAEDPSTATVADLKRMLQSMLVDRFKLELHRETTECPGYGLTVASGGLKVMEARPEDEAPPYRSPANGKEILRGKSTLASFANLLTDSVGVPVVDRTGLAGVYDFVLTLNRIFVSPLPLPNQDVSPRGPGNVCGGEGPTVRARGAQNQVGEVRAVIGYDPPVAKAVEDQLGLHLESTKVSVESLVIDHAERPASN